MRIVALAFALAFALAPVPATAQKAVEARWEYVLSIPDPASGNVHVELTLRGLAGGVKQLSFPTSAHRDAVTNVTPGAKTPFTKPPPDFAFEVDGEESFSYDVKAERAAFVDGQTLSHVGTDFALFKAEAVALEYSYQFFEGTTFRNQTTVLLSPPDGWQAEGPWKPGAAPGSYLLPEGQVLPRGYVVMGKFLASDTRVAGEKVVHYVRLGKPGEYEKDLYDYIAKATPYYAAVYGPGVEKDVLVVNAPDPMFRGGLGGANSFFVHESADLRTVAHEYAHVFQLFGTNEQQGESAIWINEGDADYHSALSLFAADVWSPQEVNKFLGDAAKDATDPALVAARLPDAAYGTSLERFAYHKGAIVLRALDALLRERTRGDVTLSDVLRGLNAVHGNASRPESAQPVDNAEMQAAVERVLGAPLGDFFARYVHGSEWPLPFEPFVPDGELVVDSLTVVPERAAPGDPVVAVAEVVNRGTKDIRRVVELELDGLEAGAANVSLDVGQNATLRFPLRAPAAGDHKVKLLYATATLHTLTPADIGIARASLVPATVRANASASLLVFLENRGEQPGTARVEVSLGEKILGATTETPIEGGGSTTLTIPLRIDRPGAATLRIHLATPQGDETLEQPLTVAEPDADGDTVPDALDAYPDDPSLSEKSFGNDVKNVPGAHAALLVLAAVGVALAWRRR